MIVRDEAAVIRRALTSAIPFIDSWLIVDTGSSDSTCKIVKQTMKGLTGTLLQSPWKGFAGSRNEALAAARSLADFVLFLDADDFLVGNAQQTRSTLHRADLWLCWAYAGWVRHARTCVIRSDVDAKWVGERHEYLSVDKNLNPSVATTSFLSMRYMHQGFRSKRKDTFLYDIASLKKTVNLRRTDKREAARAKFYIARSYHAAGELSNAYEHYLARSRDWNGDEEERWYAEFQACMLSLKPTNFESTLRWLAQLALSRPTRAEPLIEMASILHQMGEYDRALELGQHCASMPTSGDRYFVDISCTSWRAWTEIATNLQSDIHLDGLRQHYALCVLSLPGVPSNVRFAMRYLIDRCLIRSTRPVGLNFG